MQKSIVFLGKTDNIIASFPNEAKRTIGYNLNEISLGNEPNDWKPMPSIGLGVREIRARDRDGNYRVIYVLRIKNTIHVLHAFQKKTQKTDQSDLDLARQRMKAIDRKE